jgi:hypothetical protein
VDVKRCHSLAVQAGSANKLPKDALQTVMPPNRAPQVLAVLQVDAEHVDVVTAQTATWEGDP